MNLDDPNLTAYALGELDDAEKLRIEKIIATSPEARTLVDETRALASLVQGAFRADLERAAAKPLNIVPLPTPRNIWSDSPWLSLGVAALLAIAALIAAVILSGPATPVITRTSPSASGVDLSFMAETSVAGEIPASADAQSNFENRFVPAATNPTAAFPLVHSHGESYAAVRRCLENRTRPPRDVVRIHELINSFSYQDPLPQDGSPFFLTVEAATCPWEPGHRLVRLALTRRASRVEQNSVAEVAFNPGTVDSYRLLGFERRSTPTAAPGAAEDIAAGQNISALYEVVRTPNSNSVANLLTFRVRSQTANKPAAAEQTLEDRNVEFAHASPDFRFAAAVAEFGMILRESPFKGSATFASVIDWADHARDGDREGQRAAFVDLARKAQALTF